MNSFSAAARSGAVVSDFAARSDAQPWLALGLALATGALSLLTPALAIGVLAVLGVHALAREQRFRLDARALMAPTLAALIVGSWAGLAGAVGVVFIWRIFADCRWSLETANRLAPAVKSETWRARAHAWLTPLFGVCMVAYTAPHLVAGLPLDLPHVPFWVPTVTGVLAVGAIFDWGLRQAVDWRLGELARAPAAHMATHHAIFALAFGLTIDVSAGIVALVAWRLAHTVLTPRRTAEI
jgi:hypothetical protein